MTAQPDLPNAPAPLRAEVLIEIPFHDVDVMGIAWHGHYLKYLEIARTALMRKAGMDVLEMRGTGCGFPVVECRIKYIRPLRYGQKIRVEARLEEYEQRLKIGYLIVDPDSGERLTRATTLQLAVDETTGELRFEIPPRMVAAIQQARG